MALYDSWKDALPSEVHFWKRVMTGEMPQYERNLRERASGRTPFPAHLANYLAKDRVTRILDVGAGPHSVIGLSNAPSPIELVAIDPLADSYNEMLMQQGITPVTRAIRGEAERLHEYNLGKFDLIFSRNALDHSYDPLAAIDSMLHVLAKGGAIHLEGSVNEGERQSYSGLHQWNFEPQEDGDLVVWREGTSISIRDRFDGKVSVSSHGPSEWYVIVLKQSDVS